MLCWVLWFLGCGTAGWEQDVGTQRHEGPTALAPTVWGFDEDGCLVAFNGASGAVMHRGDQPGLPTDLSIEDHVYVLRGSRLFRRDRDIGPSVELGQLEGTAGLQALPGGLLVWQRDSPGQLDAERWWLLESDASVAQLLAAPFPSSAWVQEDRLEVAAGDRWLRFAHTGNKLHRVEEVVLADVHAAGTLMAPYRDGVVAMRFAGEELIVSTHGPNGRQIVKHAMPLNGVAEQLLELPHPTGWRYALLSSQPSRVTLVEVAAEVSIATLELHEPLRMLPAGALRRDLVPVPSGVVIATATGVSRLRLEDEPGLGFRYNQAFDGSRLRGPLAVDAN